MTETAPARRTDNRPDWGPILLVAGSLLMVAILIGYVIFAWSRTSSVALSAHGIAALVIGVVLTLAIGAGLMALVFYSARKGYDDEQDYGSND